MSVKRLGFAIVFVRNYVAMKQWYRETLGLEVKEADDPGEWVSFGFPEGDAELALHGGLPTGEGETPIVPSFEVNDIREMVEDLKGSGVEFVRDVHEGSEGVLLANFRDPEGNMLQLYQVVV